MAAWQGASLGRLCVGRQVDDANNALMTFLLIGLSPLSILLTWVRSIPAALAHGPPPPARSISARSRRMTSLISNARI